MGQIWVIVNWYNTEIRLFSCEKKYYIQPHTVSYHLWLHHISIPSIILAFTAFAPQTLLSVFFTTPSRLFSEQSRLDGLFLWHHIYVTGRAVRGHRFLSPHTSQSIELKCTQREHHPWLCFYFSTNLVILQWQEQSNINLMSFPVLNHVWGCRIILQ